MKISYVEVSGFRGARARVRLDLSKNINVISGRNGAGKSTVFDAIEYALTGGLSKYSVEKSGKDNLSEYYWWRGDVPAEASHVRVGFVGEAGEQDHVERSRQGGLLLSRPNLLQQLGVTSSEREAEAIARLCSVSIIRDEKISSLGLEMSEGQRYAFVREALGSIGDQKLLKKAEAALEIVQQEVAQAKSSYAEASLESNVAIAQLSREKDAEARTQLQGDARTRLADLLPTVPADVKDVLAMLREEAARSNQAIERLGKLRISAKDVLAENESVLIHRAKIETIQAERAQTLSELEVNRSRLEEATKIYLSESERSELAALLIAALDGAQAIGLVEGHCPVCDAARSEAEFFAGVQKARIRVSDLSTSLAHARVKQAELFEMVKKLESNERVQAEQIDALKREDGRISARQVEFESEAERFGVLANGVFSEEFADQSLSRLRDRALELERIALALASSLDSDRIRANESRVTAARNAVAQAASKLSKAEKAADTAKQIIHVIKRTAGEVLDERLAAISPLLEEFYLRLRPHAGWERIEYSIRGDVQRLLSLRVGNGLNPQFMFSSGQRRAAGLAFLLSVHVASQCGMLRTLMLDDPVQHVDDYRAVNLVELLAAIAGTGRQVICTVEDSGLADLMGRRMTASTARDGKRFDLEYDVSNGSSLLSSRELFPPIARVLRESA